MLGAGLEKSYADVNKFLNKVKKYKSLNLDIR